MNAPQRPMRTEAEQALLDAWENARPGLPGGSLIAARRAAAIALFSDRGLPHRRVEEWKYTDLRAGMRKAYPPA
ncbi:MAG: Fe-S cluster assembly protein SufD, partial [Bauldia litoralis]